MTAKLVAVAVANDGSIAPHAGRALRWMVYVVSELLLRAREFGEDYNSEIQNC